MCVFVKGRGGKKQVKPYELAGKLGFESLTPEIGAAEERDLAGAYASDLMSDVLAKAPQGGILLTVQTHVNVVAVAVHAGLAAVLFTGARKPDEHVRAKAVEENLALYSTPLSTFDAAGVIYALGFRGGRV